jgi:large subunit ribosomal protein L2
MHLQVKQENFVTCKATVGMTSNPDHFLEVSEKLVLTLVRSYRKQWCCNESVDHPMGGGEGKASGGHPRSRKGIRLGL